MNKVSLLQDENLAFKLSYELHPQEHQRIDLYFSIPEEIGISAQTLSEENYFYSSIKSNATFYSEQVHLPLVRSRFVSQKKGEQRDYRSNLNLFSYQLRIALDKDIKETLAISSPEALYIQALELVEHTQGLLKKLRRYTPSDKKLSSYFENVDNYLSWHVEQSFLGLLANAPKTTEQASQREVILNFCREENDYRAKNQYNSNLTIADPNRITNKMLLLQRLSEFGVVLPKTTDSLDENFKRLVKGSVTAIIMAFVMAIVLNSRTIFTEVTVFLIAFLGVIYGIREIFKDDLTYYFWRKIQRGRPKWQHTFINSLTKNNVLYQKIWLEYIHHKYLPEEVDLLLQKRRQQNKQESQLLHFRCDSKVLVKKFLPGFEAIQNQIYFSLTPFVRYLKKGEGRLYALESNKITNQSVERRYQLNLILVHQDHYLNQHIQRYKVTINRSKIINIELMDSQ